MPAGRRAPDLVTEWVGTGYGAAASVLRTARFLGRERAITVTGHDGRTARLRLLQSRFAALDTIGSQLLLGRYELTTRRLFEQLVEPGMSVVDIGANIGYFTVLSAVLTGPTGQVLAVEPEPRNLAQLQANLAAPGLEHVRLIAAACSDHLGQAELGVNAAESGWHRLLAPGGSRDGLHAVTVELTTIDTVLGDHPVDLVKIDVEGFEGPVVAGMRATLERNPGVNVVLEYSPSQSRLAGLDPSQPLRLLRDAGLTHAYLVVEDHTALRELDLAALADGQPIKGRSVNLLIRADPMRSHASLPVV